MTEDRLNKFCRIVDHICDICLVEHLEWFREIEAKIPLYLAGREKFLKEKREKCLEIAYDFDGDNIPLTICLEHLYRAVDTLEKAKIP